MVNSKVQLKYEALPEQQDKKYQGRDYRSQYNNTLKPTSNAWHVPCKPPSKNTWLNSNAKYAPRYGGLVRPLYTQQ